MSHSMREQELQDLRYATPSWEKMKRIDQLKILKENMLRSDHGAPKKALDILPTAGPRGSRARASTH